MTPIADMVRRMLEKGVAHDAIVVAVEGAELAMLERTQTGMSGGIPVDTVAEKRRAYDRERKRKVRGSPVEFHRSPPESTGHASLYKESKKEEGKEEREAVQKSVRGYRLPDDWQPSAQDQATAETLVGPLRAAGELEKFRDHWKQQPGSRGVKLDWDAAWRNWIRRAAEFQPKGSTNERRKTVHDAARELHENFVNEYINPFDKPAPSGLCDGEGADVVRLLPARGRE